ncbi:hypothetical protein [Rossellomorea vietnamensis]|uniref:Uncharacterized protein n=1 Tax=Rossellomorea vietnamensis TaxID=218284 RepID=A0A0P6VVG7_9BACI|nr:hypothetical protein [Rossellomorea vietnamensis]KPL58852.1 hypothetical protein AM506_14170 [Rossellomorea vietnamensis]
MGNIDKRNRLADIPFDYRVNKDGSIYIEYEGKQVKILKGREADKFLKKVKGADDEKGIQLIMAKATGNFKRGNERKN